MQNIQIDRYDQYDIEIDVKPKQTKPNRNDNMREPNYMRTVTL